MPIVKATRNPDSLASQGDTRQDNINEDDWFVQNDDNTYSDKTGKPVDFNNMKEDVYWNADGPQGGGNIYGDPGTFKSVDNPVWWDMIKGDPLIGGRNLADIPDYFSNPGIQKLNTDVQQKWLQQNRPQAFEKNGFLPLLKDIGSNPAGAVMLAALTAGIGSGLAGGAAVAGEGAAAGAGAAEGAAAGGAAGGAGAGSFDALLADIAAQDAAAGTIANAGSFGGAAAGTGAAEGFGSGFPDIDPSAVMGADFGTGGEGTGLLQGPATGEPFAAIPELNIPSGPPTGDAAAAEGAGFGGPPTGISAPAASPAASTSGFDPQAFLTSPESSAATSAASSLGGGGGGGGSGSGAPPDPDELLKKRNFGPAGTYTPPDATIANGLGQTPASSSNSVMALLEKLGIYGPNGIGKNAIPLAGLVGSQLMKPDTGKAASDIKASGARSSAAADQLLNAGLSGKGSASAQFEIDRWLNGQKSQIQQRYANMGRDASNDSSAQRELADAEAQSIAMRDKSAQALIAQGLQAAGLAQGPELQAALVGAQEDKEFTNAIAQMFQTLAFLQSSGARP